MNIKSLLIGSAALMTVSTGSYAADAIVMAEPEPVEYVRVCDVYGAGFFYIPGTETCLKIGGYFRFQVNGRFTGTGPRGVANAGTGYDTIARFAPNFDVRSETEWGTLRGYAELEFTYNAAPNSYYGGTTGAAGPGYANNWNLHSAFIDIGGANYLRMGRTWSPYAMWVGGGYSSNGGQYGLRRTSQITYVFNGNNSTVLGGRPGFSGFISLADDTDLNWSPDVEAGIGFGWSPNTWLRAAISYDNTVPGTGFDTIGFKVGANVDVGNGFQLGARVYYDGLPWATSNFNMYGSRWAALGAARFAFSPTAAVFAEVEWFDNAPSATVDWLATVGVDFTPVTGLLIRPEITYIDNVAGGNTWEGMVRFQRSF